MNTSISKTRATLLSGRAALARQQKSIKALVFCNCHEVDSRIAVKD